MNYLLILLIPAFALSQNFWERTEPYSYGLNQIVFGGGDTVYGSLNSGFTRSTNGGTTWTTPLVVNFVREFAVAPNGYIFVAQNQNALSRSTNRGNSFTQSSTGITDASCSSVMTTAAGTVITSTRSGIFRSTDHGANWTKVAAAAQLGEDTNVVALRRHNNILYAVSTMPTNNPEWSVAYRSTDDGVTWTKGTNKLNGVTLYNLVIRPNGHLFARSNRGVYHSTDQGNSWSAFAFTDVYVDDVSFDSTGNVYSLIDQSDSSYLLYRSTNNGSTWQPIAVPYTDFSRITFGKNGTIFLSQDQTYRSTDNGATWKALPVLFPNTTIFTESPKKELFVTAGGSAYQILYRSSDFGVTWKPMVTGVTGVPAVGFYADTILVADNFYNAKIFRSTDNGVSFKQITGTSVITGNINAIIGTSYQSIIAGTSSGIFRSVNHGKVWTKVSNTPATFLKQLSNGTMYAYRVFFGSPVMRSTDSGSTWVELKTGMGNTIVHSLAFGPNGDIFSGTDAGLFRSTDQGNNWVRIDTQSTGKPNGIYVTVNADGKLHFGGAKSGTNSTVYQSTNNGATWTSLANNNISSIDNQASIRSLFTASNGYLFAGTSSGLFRSLAKTTSVDRVAAPGPESFALRHNYPNPFNPVTVIPFSIESQGKVRLTVFDVTGKEVAVLVNEELTAGTYQTTFDARFLSSGVYFYRLTAGRVSQTKRMVLMK